MGTILNLHIGTKSLRAFVSVGVPIPEILKKATSKNAPIILHINTKTVPAIKELCNIQYLPVSLRQFARTNSSGWPGNRRTS